MPLKNLNLHLPAAYCASVVLTVAGVCNAGELIQERPYQPQLVFPVAGFAIDREHVGGRIVEFYITRDSAGPGTRSPMVWVARRKAVDLEGGAGDWIDARDCPALNEVLADLQRLPPPLWELARPFPSNRELPPTVKDGPTYEVWTRSRSQPDLSSVVITLSANHGPTVEWVQSAERRLASCWRPWTGSE